MLLILLWDLLLSCATCSCTDFLELLFYFSENAIKTAEKYLYAGLAKKPVLLRMEISASCNDIERLLESFQDVLKQIKDDYKRKQVSYSCSRKRARNKLNFSFFTAEM